MSCYLVLPHPTSWARSAHCWDTMGFEFGLFSGQVCSVTALLVAGDDCLARLGVQDP